MTILWILKFWSLFLPFNFYLYLLLENTIIGSSQNNENLSDCAIFLYFKRANVKRRKQNLFFGDDYWKLRCLSWMVPRFQREACDILSLGRRVHAWLDGCRLKGTSLHSEGFGKLAIVFGRDKFWHPRESDLRHSRPFQKKKKQKNPTTLI